MIWERLKSAELVVPVFNALQPRTTVNSISENQAAEQQLQIRTLPPDTY
jgi:hypothetical protein